MRTSTGVSIDQFSYDKKGNRFGITVYSNVATTMFLFTSYARVDVTGDGDQAMVKGALSGVSDFTNARVMGQIAKKLEKEFVDKRRIKAGQSTNWSVTDRTGKLVFQGTLMRELATGRLGLSKTTGMTLDACYADENGNNVTMTVLSHTTTVTGGIQSTTTTTDFDITHSVVRYSYFGGLNEVFDSESDFLDPKAQKRIGGKLKHLRVGLRRGQSTSWSVTNKFGKTIYQGTLMNAVEVDEKGEVTHSGVSVTQFRYDKKGNRVGTTVFADIDVHGPGYSSHIGCDLTDTAGQIQIDTAYNCTLAYESTLDFSDNEVQEQIVKNLEKGLMKENPFLGVALGKGQTAKLSVTDASGKALWSGTVSNEAVFDHELKSTHTGAKMQEHRYDSKGNSTVVAVYDSMEEKAADGTLMRQGDLNLLSDTAHAKVDAIFDPTRDFTSEEFQQSLKTEFAEAFLGGDSPIVGEGQKISWFTTDVNGMTRGTGSFETLARSDAEKIAAFEKELLEGEEKVELPVKAKVSYSIIKTDGSMLMYSAALTTTTLDSWKAIGGKTSGGTEYTLYEHVELVKDGKVVAGSSEKLAALKHLNSKYNSEINDENAMAFFHAFKGTGFAIRFETDDCVYGRGTGGKHGSSREGRVGIKVKGRIILFETAMWSLDQAKKRIAAFGKASSNEGMAKIAEAMLSYDSVDYHYTTKDGKSEDEKGRKYIDFSSNRGHGRGGYDGIYLREKITIVTSGGKTYSITPGQATEANKGIEIVHLVGTKPDESGSYRYPDSDYKIYHNKPSRVITMTDTVRAGGKQFTISTDVDISKRGLKVALREADRELRDADTKEELHDRFVRISEDGDSSLSNITSIDSDGISISYVKGGAPLDVGLGAALNCGEGDVVSATLQAEGKTYASCMETAGKLKLWIASSVSADELKDTMQDQGLKFRQGSITYQEKGDITSVVQVLATDQDRTKRFDKEGNVLTTTDKLVLDNNDELVQVKNEKTQLVESWLNGESVAHFAYVEGSKTKYATYVGGVVHKGGVKGLSYRGNAIRLHAYRNIDSKGEVSGTKIVLAFKNSFEGKLNGNDVAIYGSFAKSNGLLVVEFGSEGSFRVLGRKADDPDEPLSVHAGKEGDYAYLHEGEFTIFADATGDNKMQLVGVTKVTYWGSLSTGGGIVIDGNQEIFKQGGGGSGLMQEPTYEQVTCEIVEGEDGKVVVKNGTWTVNNGQLVFAKGMRFNYAGTTGLLTVDGETINGGVKSEYTGRYESENYAIDTNRKNNKTELMTMAAWTKMMQKQYKDNRKDDTVTSYELSHNLSRAIENGDVEAAGYHLFHLQAYGTAQYEYGNDEEFAESMGASSATELYYIMMSGNDNYNRVSDKAASDQMADRALQAAYDNMGFWQRVGISLLGGIKNAGNVGGWGIAWRVAVGVFAVVAVVVLAVATCGLAVPALAGIFSATMVTTAPIAVGIAVAVCLTKVIAVVANGQKVDWADITATFITTTGEGMMIGMALQAPGAVLRLAQGYNIARGVGLGVLESARIGHSVGVAAAEIGYTAGFQIGRGLAMTLTAAAGAGFGAGRYVIADVFFKGEEFDTGRLFLNAAVGAASALVLRGFGANVTSSFGANVTAGTRIGGMLTAGVIGVTAGAVDNAVYEQQIVGLDLLGDFVVVAGVHGAAQLVRFIYTVPEGAQISRLAQFNVNVNTRLGVAGANASLSGFKAVVWSATVKGLAFGTIGAGTKLAVDYTRFLCGGLKDAHGNRVEVFTTGHIFTSLATGFIIGVIAGYALSTTGGAHGSSIGRNVMNYSAKEVSVGHVGRSGRLAGWILNKLGMKTVFTQGAKVTGSQLYAFHIAEGMVSWVVVSPAFSVCTSVWEWVGTTAMYIAGEGDFEAFMVQNSVTGERTRLFSWRGAGALGTAAILSPAEWKTAFVVKLFSFHGAGAKATQAAAAPTVAKTVFGRALGGTKWFLGNFKVAGIVTGTNFALSALSVAQGEGRETGFDEFLVGKHGEGVLGFAVLFMAHGQYSPEIVKTKGPTTVSERAEQQIRSGKGSTAQLKRIVTRGEAKTKSGKTTTVSPSVRKAAAEQLVKRGKISRKQAFDIIRGESTSLYSKQLRTFGEKALTEHALGGQKNGTLVKILEGEKGKAEFTTPTGETIKLTGEMQGAAATILKSRGQGKQVELVGAKKQLKNANEMDVPTKTEQAETKEAAKAAKKDYNSAIFNPRNWGKGYGERVKKARAAFENSRAKAGIISCQAREAKLSREIASRKVANLEAGREASAGGVKGLEKQLEKTVFSRAKHTSVAETFKIERKYAREKAKAAEDGTLEGTLREDMVDGKKVKVKLEGTLEQDISRRCKEELIEALAVVPVEATNPFKLSRGQREAIKRIANAFENAGGEHVKMIELLGTGQGKTVIIAAVLEKAVALDRKNGKKTVVLTNTDGNVLDMVECIEQVYGKKKFKIRVLDKDAKGRQAEKVFEEADIVVTTHSAYQSAVTEQASTKRKAIKNGTKADIKTDIAEKSGTGLIDEYDAWLTIPATLMSNGGEAVKRFNKNGTQTNEYTYWEKVHQYGKILNKMQRKGKASKQAVGRAEAALERFIRRTGLKYTKAEMKEHLGNGRIALKDLKAGRDFFVEKTASGDYVIQAQSEGKSMEGLQLPAGQMQVLGIKFRRIGRFSADARAGGRVGKMSFIKPLEGGYTGNSEKALKSFDNIVGLTGTLSKSTAAISADRIGISEKNVKGNPPEFTGSRTLSNDFASKAARVYDACKNGTNGRDALNMLLTADTRTARKLRNYIRGRMMTDRGVTGLKKQLVDLKTRKASKGQIKAVEGEIAKRTKAIDAEIVFIDGSSSMTTQKTNALLSRAKRGEATWVIGDAYLIGRGTNLSARGGTAAMDFHQKRGRVNLRLIDPEKMTATQATQGMGRVEGNRFRHTYVEYNGKSYFVDGKSAYEITWKQGADGKRIAANGIKKYTEVKGEVANKVKDTHKAETELVAKAAENAGGKIPDAQSVRGVTHLKRLIENKDLTKGSAYDAKTLLENQTINELAGGKAENITAEMVEQVLPTLQKANEAAAVSKAGIRVLGEGSSTKAPRTDVPTTTSQLGSRYAGVGACIAGFSAETKRDMIIGDTDELTSEGRTVATVFVDLTNLTGEQRDLLADIGVSVPEADNAGTFSLAQDLMGSRNVTDISQLLACATVAREFKIQGISISLEDLGEVNLGSNELAVVELVHDKAKEQGNSELAERLGNAITAVQGAQAAQAEIEEVIGNNRDKVRGLSLQREEDVPAIMDVVRSDLGDDEAARLQSAFTNPDGARGAIGNMSVSRLASITSADGTTAPGVVTAGVLLTAMPGLSLVEAEASCAVYANLAEINPEMAAEITLSELTERLTSDESTGSASLSEGRFVFDISKGEVSLPEGTPNETMLTATVVPGGVKITDDSGRTTTISGRQADMVASLPQGTYLVGQVSGDGDNLILMSADKFLKPSTTVAEAAQTMGMGDRVDLVEQALPDTTLAPIIQEVPQYQRQLATRLISGAGIQTERKLGQGTIATISANNTQGQIKTTENSTIKVNMPDAQGNVDIEIRNATVVVNGNESTVDVIHGKIRIEDTQVEIDNRGELRGTITDLDVNITEYFKLDNKAKLNFDKAKIKVCIGEDPTVEIKGVGNVKEVVFQQKKGDPTHYEIEARPTFEDIARNSGMSVEDVMGRVSAAAVAYHSVHAAVPTVTTERPAMGKSGIEMRDAQTPDLHMPISGLDAVGAETGVGATGLLMGMVTPLIVDQMKQQGAEVTHAEAEQAVTRVMGGLENDVRANITPAMVAKSLVSCNMNEDAARTQLRLMTDSRFTTTKEETIKVAGEEVKRNVTTANYDISVGELGTIAGDHGTSTTDIVVGMTAQYIVTNAQRQGVQVTHNDVKAAVADVTKDLSPGAKKLVTPNMIAGAVINGIRGGNMNASLARANLAIAAEKALTVTGQQEVKGQDGMPVIKEGKPEMEDVTRANFDIQATQLDTIAGNYGTSATDIVDAMITQPIVGHMQDQGTETSARRVSKVVGYVMNTIPGDARANITPNMIANAVISGNLNVRLSRAQIAAQIGIPTTTTKQPQTGKDNKPVIKDGKPVMQDVEIPNYNIGGNELETIATTYGTTADEVLSAMITMPIVQRMADNGVQVTPERVSKVIDHTMSAVPNEARANITPNMAAMAVVRGNLNVRLARAHIATQVGIPATTVKQPQFGEDGQPVMKDGEYVMQDVERPNYGIKMSELETIANTYGTTATEIAVATATQILEQRVDAKPENLRAAALDIVEGVKPEARADITPAMIAGTLMNTGMDTKLAKAQIAVALGVPTTTIEHPAEGEVKAPDLNITNDKLDTVADTYGTTPTYVTAAMVTQYLQLRGAKATAEEVKDIVVDLVKTAPRSVRANITPKAITDAVIAGGLDINSVRAHFALMTDPRLTKKAENSDAQNCFVTPISELDDIAKEHGITTNDLIDAITFEPILNTMEKGGVELTRAKVDNVRKLINHVLGGIQEEGKPKATPMMVANAVITADTKTRRIRSARTQLAIMAEPQLTGDASLGDLDKMAETYGTTAADIAAIVLTPDVTEFMQMQDADTAPQQVRGFVDGVVGEISDEVKTNVTLNMMLNAAISSGLNAKSAIGLLEEEAAQGIETDKAEVEKAEPGEAAPELLPDIEKMAPLAPLMEHPGLVEIMARLHEQNPEAIDAFLDLVINGAVNEGERLEVVFNNFNKLFEGEAEGTGSVEVRRLKINALAQGGGDISSQDGFIATDTQTERSFTIVSEVPVSVTKTTEKEGITTIRNRTGWTIFEFDSDGRISLGDESRMPQFDFGRIACAMTDKNEDTTIITEEGSRIRVTHDGNIEVLKSVTAAKAQRGTKSDAQRKALRAGLQELAKALKQGVDPEEIKKQIAKKEGKAKGKKGQRKIKITKEEPLVTVRLAKDGKYKVYRGSSEQQIDILGEYGQVGNLQINSKGENGIFKTVITTQDALFGDKALAVFQRPIGEVIAKATLTDGELIITNFAKVGQRDEQEFTYVAHGAFDIGEIKANEKGVFVTNKADLFDINIGRDKQPFTISIAGSRNATYNITPDGTVKISEGDAGDIGEIDPINRTVLVKNGIEIKTKIPAGAKAEVTLREAEVSREGKVQPEAVVASISIASEEQGKITEIAEIKIDEKQDAHLILTNPDPDKNKSVDVALHNPDSGYRIGLIDLFEDGRAEVRVVTGGKTNIVPIDPMTEGNKLEFIDRVIDGGLEMTRAAKAADTRPISSKGEGTEFDSHLAANEAFMRAFAKKAVGQGLADSIDEAIEAIQKGMRVEPDGAATVRVDGREYNYNIFILDGVSESHARRRGNDLYISIEDVKAKGLERAIAHEALERENLLDAAAEAAGETGVVDLDALVERMESDPERYDEMVDEADKKAREFESQTEIIAEPTVIKATEAALGEEFDNNIETELERLRNSNADIFARARNAIRQMEIREIFLVDKGPDDSNVYMIATGAGDHYMAFISKGRVIGLAVHEGQMDSGADRIEFKVLPLDKDTRLEFTRKMKSELEAAKQGKKRIAMADRTKEYGSETRTPEKKAGIYLPAINFFYKADNLKKDYINNAILRKVVASLRPETVTANQDTVLLVRSEGERNVAAIALEGHTVYGLHSLKTRNISSDYHLQTIVHEFSHEMFAEMNEESQNALKDYFLSEGELLARVITSSPRYANLKGNQLVSEMIAHIMGALTGGQVEVARMGKRFNRLEKAREDDKLDWQSAGIKAGYINILVKYGFLPRMFGESLGDDMDANIDVAYLEGVYPQAKKPLGIKVVKATKMKKPTAREIAKPKTAQQAVADVAYQFENGGWMGLLVNSELFRDRIGIPEALRNPLARKQIALNLNNKQTQENINCGVAALKRYLELSGKKPILEELAVQVTLEMIKHDLNNGQVFLKLMGEEKGESIPVPLSVLAKAASKYYGVEVQGAVVTGDLSGVKGPSIAHVVRTGKERLDHVVVAEKVDPSSGSVRVTETNREKGWVGRKEFGDKWEQRIILADPANLIGIAHTLPTAYQMNIGVQAPGGVFTDLAPAPVLEDVGGRIKDMLDDSGISGEGLGNMENLDNIKDNLAETGESA